MNDREKEYVLNVYTDPRRPYAFGTLNQLYRHIKDTGQFNIKKKDLEKFMREHEIFTSHLTNKRLKHYAKIIAPYPNYGVEVDSAMMPFKDRNRLKYMIVARDQFSRKIAARAIPNLTANVVDRSLNEILDELGGGYAIIRTDR